MHCGSRYTPEPKQQGYPDEVRKRALEMYVDGMNLRRIGRHLGLHHSTISLWVKAYAANLPETPKPAEVKDAEMDELFTFIGDKKTGSTSSPS
jgi:transposase-like protein